ncbi:MAG: hypothetical protein AAB646_00520 [Patescibacteria group bacterium]
MNFWGKYKKHIVAGLFGFGLAALFLWPQIYNPYGEIINKYKKAGLECMSGHARAIQHFHPHLTILVDNKEEGMPANLGIVSNCMGEIHTHDATGTLHVESSSADKVFYFKQFFGIYDKPMEREGYSLTMAVDGQPSQELGELVLKDKQEIVLEYKKQ